MVRSEQYQRDDCLIMADVKIRVLYGYRGLITKNVYLDVGVHGVTQAQADYLIENGHAELVEPEPEVETDDTPKRKTRRKKTDKSE